MKKLLIILISTSIFYSCKKDNMESKDDANSNSGVEYSTIDSSELLILQNFMIDLDSGVLSGTFDFDSAMMNSEASINAAMIYMDTISSGVYIDSIQTTITIDTTSEGKRIVDGDDVQEFFDDLYTEIDERMDDVTLPGDFGSEGIYIRVIDIVWDESSTSTNQTINVKYQYAGFFHPISNCSFTDDWLAVGAGCGSNSGSPYECVELMGSYLNNYNCNDNVTCIYQHVLDGTGPLKLFPKIVSTNVYSGGNYSPDIFIDNTNPCLNATQIQTYTDGIIYVANTYGPTQSILSYSIIGKIYTSIPSIYEHVAYVSYGDCVLMEVPFNAPPTYEE